MRFARNLLCLVGLSLSSCRTVAEMPVSIPPTVDGYKKVMEDQLGPIWYREVAENVGTTVGTVKLTFELPAAGGRPRNLKTVSNDAGVADERIARAAVERLRAPPIPATILEAVGQDYLAFDESFTVYQTPPASPGPSAPKR